VGDSRFRRDPLARAVRAGLTPDLLKPEYRGSKRPFAGHCYVATEAYYHLVGGKAAGLTRFHIKHEDASHWWLLDLRGRVIDLTAEQFKTPVPYERGRRRAFLPPTPRAEGDGAGAQASK
jgi:hypothetical protein